MIVLYALWAGLVWWLRGGKFGAIWRLLFKREPGTTVTRIGCAALMAAPLALIDPVLGLLAVSIYAAMTIGYFRESMGLEKQHDFAWLALWGLVVATIAILPAAILTQSIASILWAGLGTLAAPAYYFNRPLGRQLGLDWTERAEMLTGAALSTAIWSAVV